MRQAELRLEPVLCNVMAENRLAIVLAQQRPESERRWVGAGAGQPKAAGYARLHARAGPGEDGRAPSSPPLSPGRLRPPRGSRARPLPAAWPVGTPPSATGRGAPQVRRIRLMARGPALAPAPAPLPRPAPPVRSEAPSPPGTCDLGSLRPLLLQPPAPARGCRSVSLPPSPGEGMGGSALQPGAPRTLPPPPSSCSAMFMVESPRAAP